LIDSCQFALPADIYLEKRPYPFYAFLHLCKNPESTIENLLFEDFYQFEKIFDLSMQIMSHLTIPVTGMKCVPVVVVFLHTP
jgi:hypothetical protein